jgi:hypothetical protein
VWQSNFESPLLYVHPQLLLGCTSAVDS